MKKVVSFIKSEPVLCISGMLAVISAFFVRPSRAYLDYIDFRTLGLLFCLMSVMAGLSGLGLFDFVAGRMLKKVSSVRSVALTLSLLCFFFAMLVTNDVALISLVPFTIIILKLSKSEKYILPVVVLETIAANMGSMLTPVGNPQNLFLFSHFEMSAKEFLSAVAPYALLSLVMICLCVLFYKNTQLTACGISDKKPGDVRKLLIYAALFVLALLTVFRVLPIIFTFCITLIVLLIFDRKTILKVDYSLLLTFVFLFVFIGNLGNITVINEFLHDIIDTREVITAVVCSQFCSNVPTAILLSDFTSDGAALLTGTNIGGLGTLIASMASLISFKLVSRENVSKSKYIIFFSILNIIFLLANLLLYRGILWISA